MHVKLFVLDDDRQIGFPQTKVKHLDQSALVVIFNQEKTGKARVRLLGRQFMRMGVIPVSTAPVTDSEILVVTRARFDRRRRVTVHRCGRVQAMPVNDGGLFQLIVKAG